MPLQSDAISLRDASGKSLLSAVDHFAYSKRLWLAVTGDGRRRRRLLVNPLTGSRVTGADVLAVVTAAEEVYLPSAAIGQFVSITEAFIADLIRLWVVAHPFHFRDSVDVQTIVSAPDKPAILQAMADVYVAGLAYRQPREWFKQLNTIVKLGVPSDPQVDAFAELKATRDVFVHNRGIANDVYLRKAGSSARAANGQPLDLPDPYIHDAYRLCHAIVADVGTAAAARA